jgi:hypothetical protein
MICFRVAAPLPSCQWFTCVKNGICALEMAKYMMHATQHEFREHARFFIYPAVAQEQQTIVSGFGTSLLRDICASTTVKVKPLRYTVYSTIQNGKAV